VTDVQGPGRVGRNELDHHFLLAASRRATECVGLFEDVAHDFELGRRPQAEVDETGTGDLGAVDQRRGRQLGQQQLCQLPRIALQRARQLHRQIAREVTVGSLLGSFDRDFAVGLGRRDAAQGATHQVGKVGFQVVTHRAASRGGFCRAIDYTMPAGRRRMYDAAVPPASDRRRGRVRFCVNSRFSR